MSCIQISFQRRRQFSNTAGTGLPLLIKARCIFSSNSLISRSIYIINRKSIRPEIRSGTLEKKGGCRVGVEMYTTLSRIAFLVKKRGVKRPPFFWRAVPRTQTSLYTTIH